MSIVIRKVNFYSADIFNKSRNNDKQNYRDIKKYIQGIIDNDSSESHDFKVINLSSEDTLHQCIDVFEYQGDYVFMRASNQKPSGSYLQRNYSTNVPEAVLEGTSEREKGIEQYTYLLFNYTTGILGIVSRQGAPNQKVLNTMFSKYCSDYYLKLTPIPNADGIDRIYKGKDPRISQIEIEVPVPDAGVLEQWFDWKTRDILDIQSGSLKATVKISGVERQLISSGVDETKGLLDCIQKKINMYKKAKVRGKVAGEKTQDYSFFGENFSYTIEVPSYRVVNYEKKYFSSDELVNIYRDNMLAAYNENSEMLSTIVNR